MKKFIQRNIRYILAIIIICTGAKYCFNANGLLGIIGNILIMIGALLTIFSKKNVKQ